MNKINRSRYCTVCAKALRACICHAIVKIDNPDLIVIVQHPAERHHPMGTARILELSLSSCLVIQSAEPELSLQLHELCSHPTNRCYLLYPDGTSLVASPKLERWVDKNRHFLQEPEQQRVFILLDATWRKAYGMLASSPLLQGLPKVQLPSGYQSQYKVRKSTVKGALSTVEAAAYLLSALEGKACSQTPYQSLLDTLETMVDFQINRMPDAVKLRY